jgi:hypothetical protein
VPWTVDLWIVSMARGWNFWAANNHVLPRGRRHLAHFSTSCSSQVQPVTRFEATVYLKHKFDPCFLEATISSGVYNECISNANVMMTIAAACEKKRKSLIWNFCNKGKLHVRTIRIALVRARQFGSRIGRRYQAAAFHPCRSKQHHGVTGQDQLVPEPI